MRMMPFGMRAPISRNFFGLLRKSTISSNSSFASRAPAMSANVTRCEESVGSITRAFDWPKLNACMPAPFTWRVRNQKRNAIKKSGIKTGASVRNQNWNPDCPCIAIETFASWAGVTPYVASVSGRPEEGSLRETFSDSSAYLRFSESPLTVIVCIFPAATSAATAESGTSVASWKRLETSEYPLMRSRNIRTVVTRLPKNEGPPSSMRQPRSFGAGFPFPTDFPFGFFGATAMKGTIP